jgi:hypothetical protein
MSEGMNQTGKRAVLEPRLVHMLDMIVAHQKALDKQSSLV